MKKNELHEVITNIASKRGFFFPTAEIYNGPAGFWTYGHLGTLMKHKWENLWRNFFLGLNENYVEIEGSCILPKKVFEASGHLQRFTDPLTNCEKCKFQFRADEFLEDELDIRIEGLNSDAMTKLIADNKLKCPKCGGKLGKVQWFNMMFGVKLVGSNEENAYLSPETAQNPYLSFKHMFMSLREQLPMGLAVIGKAFRNEISPRQGFFRLREFTQAELQIFFNPDSIKSVDGWNELKQNKLRLFLVKNRKEGKVVEIAAEQLLKDGISQWYAYHLAKIQEFYLEVLKIPSDKFRFRELSKEERAFYNEMHFDVEIYFETLGGFKEVGGLHLRGNYDLSKHMAGSQEKMEVLVDGKRILLNVLELSFGVDRNIWALLDVFFKQEKERTIFSFPYGIAPIEAAVFPLVNKDGLPEKSQKIYGLLKDNFRTFYDCKGSVGKLYRRMDEIGTPFCVTIDHQTLKDDSVTVRDIKSMKQIRVRNNVLVETLRKLLQGAISFGKSGVSFA